MKRILNALIERIVSNLSIKRSYRTIHARKNKIVVYTDGKNPKDSPRVETFKIED